uniref:G-protein coupled receptors family 1 profile domain-containing protein n=1 Tax=Anguilla anguilla TaxID=7936 RepID=A0A0E9SMQ8_ANGAN
MSPYIVWHAMTIFVNHVISRFNVTLFVYIPFLLIVLSYFFIAGALSKMASWEGRFKAIKTCSAHLMLVSLLLPST